MNRPYRKEDDPTASTIDTKPYLECADSELKRYTEEHQILEMLDMKIKMVRLENEQKAMTRIYSDTDFPESEMSKMVDEEIRQVEKLIHQKTSWDMGMCLLCDKDKY